MSYAVELKEEEEMLINQSYKVWKKNAPYIYDFFILKSLEWPSTTFQWLPETTPSEMGTWHYAIISTNSS